MRAHQNIVGVVLGLFIIFPLAAFADDATSTPIVATSTDTVTITIRDGSITAFNGTTTLPEASSPDVLISPSNSTSTIAVPARSLLSALTALDTTTTDFDITDLAYFSSFNSFIINCIAISTASTTHCFNWTYAVNGSFPQVGIDHHILQNGDVVYLFFGPPRQVALSTTTAIVGEQFTATAQSYDLGTGQYIGVAGVTLGVGTANPDFSFTELATSTSDAGGNALFAVHATGTFSVGIQEDFYFPSALITIVEEATSTVSTPPDDNSPPSSGGGGGGDVVHTKINVALALSYLASKQKADGSFDSALLTDWAAIAFAASDPGASKTLLRNYLLTATPALSSATDYERHAMALQALGIDPYAGTPTNYIAQITGAFDGNQIGDASLDNDDIFALFPLLKAGYSSSDDIIQKTTAFIISRQQGSGVWDSSVDVTAAAIQALSQIPSLPGVAEALTRAENYLHSQQQSNGGFGNSFSTSWALQAIAALGQSASSWAPGNLDPNDYLSLLQQSDGGIEPTGTDTQTRVWATEYAIVGSLGRTWNSLLQSFPKPVSTSSGSGIVAGVSTSTVAAATSTPSVATPPLATSTPEIASNSTPSIVASTSTRTTVPLLPKPKKMTAKKIAPPPAPAPVATATTASEPIAQTAAAATPSESFLGKIWYAIASFFSWLF